MKNFSKIVVLLLVIVLSVFLLACNADTEITIKYMVDGTLYKTITIKEGSSLESPVSPTKEGFIFDGWYFDKDTWSQEFKDSLDDVDTTKTVIVHAKWEPIAAATYTITFDSNDGSSVAPITKAAGAAITAPTPTKDGYDFLGWYKDNSTFNVAFSAATMPAESFTVYAKWEVTPPVTYTITFDSNDGSSVAPITKAAGAAITAPTPTKDGYDFLGWYKDNNTFNVAFSATTMPAESFTVYAKWDVTPPVTYTITFDSNNGSSVAPITKEADEVIAAPTAPIKEGYKFIGWYEDNNAFEMAYSFVTMPSESFTLYAKWRSLGSYTVAELWTEAQQTFLDIWRDFINEEDEDILSYYELIDGAEYAQFLATALEATLDFTLVNEMLAIEGSYPLAFECEDGDVDKAVAFFNTVFGDFEYIKLANSNIIVSNTQSLNDILSGNCVFEDGAWLNGNKSLLIRYTGDGESYDIPNTVVTIGYGAFAVNDSLISITMPDSITSIGNSAFAYCVNLTTVSIPNGITTIDIGTFTGCASLATMSIPNSVTYIDEWAFAGCESLTSIVIPDSVTYLGSWAFADCTNLATITMSANIKSIGEGVFNDTAWLESQDEGVIYFGAIAYQYKQVSYGMVSIEIKEGTTTIAAKAFYHCSNLVSVTIPSSVTYIEDYAFDNCENLVIIIINAIQPPQVGESVLYDFGNLLIFVPEDSLGSYYAHEYWGCYDIYSQSEIVEDKFIVAGGELIKYIGNDSDVTIPDSVIVMDSPAFYGNQNIVSVTIPSSVIRIGDSVFSSCYNLSVIFINATTPPERGDIFGGSYYDVVILVPDESLSIYKDQRYYYIDNIYPQSIMENGGFIISEYGTLIKYLGNDSDVTIPDGIQEIGYNAFCGCSSLITIYLPSSVTSIENAFEGCTSLVSIEVDANNATYSSIDGVLFSYDHTILVCYPAAKTDIIYNIPDGVCEIGEAAFSGCQYLQHIVIPDRITFIGEWAFAYCNSLISIVISANINGISDYTFYNCSSLAAVIIPEGVIYIGTRAFGGCTNLSTIILPSGLLEVEYDAFYDTAWYDSQDDGVLYLAHIAFGYKGYIGNDAVIEIKEGTRAIAFGAFANYYDIISLTLPASLEYMGNTVFADYSNIRYVFFNAIEPPQLGYAVFGYNPDMCIFVPDASVNAYKDNANWWMYKDIVYPQSALVDGCFVVVDDVLVKYIGATEAVVIIPDNVTAIGSEAFAYHNEIVTVIMPEGITEIGTNAFMYCDLEYVVIPVSVKTIHEFAFFYDNPSTVYYGGSETDINSVAIATGNDALTNFYYYSQTENLDGNHWYYNDYGLPTKWE